MAGGPPFRALWPRRVLAYALCGMLLAARYPHQLDAPEAPEHLEPFPIYSVARMPPEALSVRWQVGRAGTIRALHEDYLLPIAAEVYGVPVRVSGTDYGRLGEYDKEPTHLIGCAVDILVPRLPRAELREKTEQLALRLANEVDARARVVGFFQHPLRNEKRKYRDHIHVAVRCLDEHDATMWQTLFDWNPTLDDLTVGRSDR